MSEFYSASDAITAEKLAEFGQRNVDDRTDDFATVSNSEIADLLDRLKMTFSNKHQNYLILRLAAARLRGEKPLKRGPVQ